MTQRVRAITGCSKGDEPSAPVLALAHHLQWRKELEAPLFAWKGDEPMWMSHQHQCWL
jgi:hypothetical protein